MSQPIADYALIGDMRTAALVGSDGSIDWACVPRFDSPAMFASLVGDDRHGQWLVAPAHGGRCTQRRYRRDTLVLETYWVTPRGEVRVSDFMAVGGAPSKVVRMVEGVAGETEMRMQLTARMGYGQLVPAIAQHGRAACLTAGQERVWLHSTVDVANQAGSCVAQFGVAAGDTVSFTLTEASPASVDIDTDPREWRTATERFWTEWIERCTYDGPWQEQVRRSLLILKALTYAPSGAILAAATTSLPESLGGSRNWDYRFCWLRDAAFTLDAFVAAGYHDEAASWRDWLLRATADETGVRIMYDLDGLRCPSEQTIGWLPGHSASAPVRIGNAAATQYQHDVWGQVLAALGGASTAGVERAPGQDRLETALLTEVRRRWHARDHGLWEVRGPRLDFVHSKVMCWVAVDRTIRGLESHSAAPLKALWELRRLRKSIHDDICAKGFDATRASFTQAYGSPRLDAALLLLPRYGFLPWTDPRVVGTVNAVCEELTRHGLLARYLVGDTGPNVDGVPGDEGAFLACSFWLVDALNGLGRPSEAVALFERLIALANDVGMLSEQSDPVTGALLGNTPQALSHAAVVTSAINLGQSTAGSDLGRLPLQKSAAS